MITDTQQPQKKTTRRKKTATTEQASKIADEVMPSERIGEKAAPSEIRGEQLSPKTSVDEQQSCPRGYQAKDEENKLNQMKRMWVVVAVLKVIFCAASLQLFLGQSIVLFLLVGFLPPLGLMFFYAFRALHMAGKDQSLLRVAGDSTYYLGFLFTIASILAAMADLGLGAVQEETMTYIASRFALAMLTTLIGIGFRVYIVTFVLKANEDAKEAGLTHGGSHFLDPQSSAIDVIRFSKLEKRAFSIGLEGGCFPVRSCSALCSFDSTLKAILLSTVLPLM